VIVGLLKDVSAGLKRPEAALHEWPNVENEPAQSIRRAWHNLSHYAADADIREKDPRYAACQRGILEEDIRELSTLSTAPSENAM
jgi:hypothetical protein